MPFQADTFIGANERIEIDGFLYGGSNPIDVLDMKTNTGSMSSGRRYVGDGPR